MPRARWDRLDEDRKQRILLAATEEFAENGFEGASYNGIIATAGISKGAMYYYFDDKMDLFVTTVRHALGPMFESIGALGAVDRASFWPTVRDMTVGSIVFTQTHPQQLTLYRELLALHQSHREHPLVAALFVEFETFTSVMLDVGQRVGAVRSDLPPGLLEAAANGLGHGVDAWYLSHLDPDDDPRDVANLTVDLMRRLCAPPEPK